MYGNLFEAMRRFYRGHIVGVFGLMRCDDVVVAVEKVHAVTGHLQSLTLLASDTKNGQNRARTGDTSISRALIATIPN